MTESTRAPERRRTDLVSLIFGLLFLGVAGSWAANHFLDLDWGIDWSLPNLGWVVAGGLVVLGVLGILASLRREKTTTDPAGRTPEADRSE